MFVPAVCRPNYLLDSSMISMNFPPDTPQICSLAAPSALEFPTKEIKN